MAHNIPMDFQAFPATTREVPLPRFEAEGGDATIVIRGGVSAGGAGWTLSARATRQRRRIALNVIARRELPPARAGSLEEFDYVATLRGVEPGRYRIRLSHLFHAPELGLAADPLSPAELTVFVGPLRP